MKPERKLLEMPLPGVTLAVDQVGTGPVPLLWLHSEWGSYADPPLNDEVLNQATVITIHHPGWGESVGVDAFRSLVDIATAYWWALDELQLTAPMVLVGHGIGATIAAEMAAQQPGRSSAALLITPFGLFREDFPGVDIFALLPRDVIGDLYVEPQGPVATSHLPSAADGYERGIQAIRRVEVLGAAGRFLFPIPDTGVQARLYRLSGIPVHLVFGRKDGVVPWQLSELWQKELPDARCTVIDSGSHMVPYEATDDVSRIVLASIVAAVPA